MYIVVTFLHTCNRTVTLIAERLLHIQINSPYLYLSFIFVHKVMYTICKAYILFAYEKKHNCGSNSDLLVFCYFLCNYIYTIK